MERRAFVKTGLAAGTAALTSASAGPLVRATAPGLRPLNGNINHSVCKWCYPDLTVDELGAAGKEFGLQSVELIGPDDWPALAKHDLICAMASPPPSVENAIPQGFNRFEYQESLVPSYIEYLPLVKKAGYPNVICFSGNREGMSDEEGLENCVKGLQKIVPTAEQHGVTVCMELLNSKVNHADYMCDHTPWGVELVQRVGSDRFKLLYDIYHMQIMEGDVIRTIQDNHQYLAHYHTGGNPGRHEIDDSQELNYGAIMRAIVETGHKGFVAQEFIPTRDPLASLREGIAICDV